MPDQLPNREQRESGIIRARLERARLRGHLCAGCHEARAWYCADRCETDTCRCTHDGETAHLLNEGD